MKPAPRLCGFLLAALLVGAQAPAPDAVVAQSGATTLTVADARRLVDAADPALREQMQKDPAVLPRLVRAELLQMLLLDQARGKKWDQLSDIAFRANQARDAVIVNTYIASLTSPPADYPAEADIQAAYAANKTRFLLPRQYQLAQIFIAAPAGDSPQAMAATQKKLHDIVALLGKPKADFAAIARARSEDRATADKGGNLGWMREDQLIAPIRDVVAGLPDNTASQPIRAPDGWHIVKLLGTRPASAAPLVDVRAQIVRALRQQRMAQNERAMVQDLLRRQPIQIDEIQLQRAVQP